MSDTKTHARHRLQDTEVRGQTCQVFAQNSLTKWQNDHTWPTFDKDIAAAVAGEGDTS